MISSKIGKSAEDNYLHISQIEMFETIRDPICENLRNLRTV